jgi:hypothetical protein
MLINTSTSDGRDISLRIPAAVGTGTLERLQAPSAHSTRRVTLGGQRFASATATGALAGRARIESVAPTAGAYAIKLPAASAALLTVSGQ